MTEFFLLDLLMKMYIFRGKHWCIPEQPKIKVLQKEYEFVYKQFWGKFGVSRVNMKEDPQQFPGFLDRGTPLVITENERHTIVGIFRGHYLTQDGGDGPMIFDRLYPEIVNWIVENSDWTWDSSGQLFTSCSCGISDEEQPPPSPPRHKRSVDSSSYSRKTQSNRIFEGTDVPARKYPWEVLIFNRLQETDTVPAGTRCSLDESSALFKTETTPDTKKYDLCSGSLISNVHILTSANCILKNRLDMEIKINEESVQFCSIMANFTVLIHNLRIGF